MPGAYVPPPGVPGAVVVPGAYVDPGLTRVFGGYVAPVEVPGAYVEPGAYVVPGENVWGEDRGTSKARVKVRALSRSTVAGRVFDTAVAVEVGSQRVFVGPRVLPPSRVGSRVRASVIDDWLVGVVDGDRSSRVAVLVLE